MTSTQILWILLPAVIVMIAVLAFAGRHHRRAQQARKYSSGDPGTWAPSMSVDSGSAGCGGSGASGADCGSSS